MSGGGAVEATGGNAGPGELLRAAREEKGLAQREAADLLNLPCRFVTAMEDDAFERLPAATFARGYLRAYARLLNLDADEVLSRYLKVAPPEPVEVVHRPPRRPVIDPSWLLIAGAILVLAVAGTMGWLLFGGEDRSEAGAVEQAEEMQATPAITDTGNASAAPPVVDATAESASGAESSPLVPATDGELGEVAGGTPSGTTVDASPRTAVVEPGDDVIEVDAGPGDDVLEISYREDCWTEIHDLDGALIFQDLVRSNRHLRVTGAAPFRILLGYAGGASVTLNGQDVALGPHTRDGVANLVVGQ